MYVLIVLVRCLQRQSDYNQQIWLCVYLLAYHALVHCFIYICRLSNHIQPSIAKDKQSSIACISHSSVDCVPFLFTYQSQASSPHWVCSSNVILEADMFVLVSSVMDDLIKHESWWEALYQRKHASSRCVGVWIVTAI